MHFYGSSRVFIVFAAFLATTFIAAAGEPAPRIACGQRVFDFGERMDSENFKHDFEIINEGELTLEIGRVRSSCGCTVARISSKRIGPGDSARVEVNVVLSGRSGTFEKEIRLETNDPNSENFSLRIRGTVIPSREIRPRHIFFRSLSADDEVKQSSSISFNHEPVHISSVRSEVDFLRAELVEIESGRRYRVEVTTLPPLASDQLNGDISVIGADGNSLFKIPVWLQLVRKLRVSPATIVVYGDEPESVKRQVVVRKDSVGEFKIVDVELPGSGMVASVHPLKGFGYRVEIDNIPVSEEIDGRTIVIATDVEDMERIEVPFAYVEK